MAYKFSETNKVNDEFTKVFGIGFKPFYDGLMSVASKQLCIDILKFDEWLQKKHGSYEDEGKSMMDVVREHYGDKGVELVDALTGADDEESPKSDKRKAATKNQKSPEAIDPKKVNERIAMAMLRQCALVWEHCARIDEKVTECELKFADVWNGMGDYRMWKKCPIGHIDIDLDKCEYQDVFDRKMWEMEGVLDYWPDGRWTRVQMFFRTSDTDPQMGFECSYPVESVFDVARDFCQMNGCPSLLTKTVFGMDESGKWARLPEVKATVKAVKPKATGKPKATAKKTSAPNNSEVVTKQSASCLVTTAEPTLEERLRAALLRQLKQAA